MNVIFMYSLIKAVTNQPLGVTYASNCERPWHVPQRQCDPFTRWLGCRNYSNQYRDRNNPINASRKGLACIVRFKWTTCLLFVFWKLCDVLAVLYSTEQEGIGNLDVFTVYMYTSRFVFYFVYSISLHSPWICERVLW